MQNDWLLEHETFGCVLTLEMFIRNFSYEIMLSSGLIKLFYNTVMPCAAVLLQPTNNYIFMLCKVNLYASDNLIWNSKPVYSRLKLFGYIWDLTIQTSCYHITGRAFKCYSHEHKGFALDTSKGISFQIRFWFWRKNVIPFPRYTFVPITGEFHKWKEAWDGWGI